MNFKKSLKYILSFALAALLLWIAFRNVDDWPKFWHALTSCKWPFLLLAMFIGFISFFVRSLRWKMLIDPLDDKIGLYHVCNAINISYLLNLVIPRGGDVIRCFYISKHSETGPDGQKKASFDKVLGTAILDRLWDTLFMVLLVVVILVLMWKRFSIFVADVYDKAALNRTLILALAAALVAGVVLIWLVWKYRDRNSLCGKCWKFLIGLLEGLGTCLRMKQIWKFLIYTVLVWTCYWFMSTSIIWALDADSVYGMTVYDGLFLAVLGAVSSLIPVPGGFGAFHSMVGFALASIYGIPIDVALVFATLSHGVQTVGQIICGGTSYILEMK